MSLSCDDESISDSDTLFRRIPKKPPYLTPIDAITGELRAAPAAFSIKKEPDGLSVHIDSLITRLQLRTVDLCQSWESHGVACFPVSAIRPETGVVSKEDPDDKKLGKAHGVISSSVGIPPPAVWNPIRDRICAASEFHASDPHPERSDDASAGTLSGVLALPARAWGWIAAWLPLPGKNPDPEKSS